VPGRTASRVLGFHVLVAACLLFASAECALAQDPLTKLRAEYAAQTNPVDKAKALAKLAPHEMTAARALSKAGDDVKALAALGKYRDEAVATTHALIATGVDASRHSRGFRELQIGLRMFIQRLDDLTLSLQQDERSAFRDVKADLEMAQNSLIDALFPVDGAKRPARRGTK
jgi:hypothetical protein